ncbi:MAG: DUF559 domain-containing protein [Xanthobacteraceae bacterium]
MERFRKETARRLRATATDAESRLWRHLRRLPMFGSHFRRQVSVGPYFVDFACMAARLNIEVDGSQHGSDHGIARDEARTRWLEARGYRVIRFWNNEVVENIDGVVATVYTALYGALDSKNGPHATRTPAKTSFRHPPHPGAHIRAGERQRAASANNL